MSRTISTIMTSMDADITDFLSSDSLIEALYFLSEATQSDRLLVRFLQIMLEKTGTSKGVFLLPADKDWSIAVTGQKNNISLLSPSSLQNSQILPQSVIEWVINKQKPLLSNDLPSGVDLRTDSYIQTHQPLFFAGFPLLYQKNFKGIVYLENREKTEKFSPQQLKCLNFLCLQAAIHLNHLNLLPSSTSVATSRDEKQENNKSIILDLEAKLAEIQAELKEAQLQLIDREKLATLGLLSAGVAHEIRNPLNFVTNCSETSEDIVEEILENLEKQRDLIPSEEFKYFQEMLKDVKNNATIVRQQGQRVEGIVRSMMQHARSEEQSRQPTDINQLLDRAALLAYHSRKASKQGIHINMNKNYDDSFGLIPVAEGDLSRAFINLIDNACYALESKYRTSDVAGESPSLWLTTQDRDQHIVIHIRDNGEGIPTEIKEKLFTPFFTTKPLGEGTGLGLFLTRNIIIEQHQGQLQVQSEVGQYTEFIITLPKQ